MVVHDEPEWSAHRTMDNKMTDIEPFAVSIADGARLIGCGRSKFYELINAKQIPLIKLGRKSLVPVAALRDYIASKSGEAA